MGMIPNRLHYVWVGAQIPLRNASNMLKWVLENVLYEAYFWTETRNIDRNTTAILDALVAMRFEGKIAGVDMKDDIDGISISIDTPEDIPHTLYVRSITSIPAVGGDATILFEELETMRNYGAASDILRLWILYDLGGIYMDFDIFSNGSPLPLCIQAPRDILFASTNRSNHALNNCVIASVRHNSKLESLIRYIELNYRDYYSELTDVPGVWDVGELTTEMEGELDLYRARLKQAGSAPEQVHWKHKIAGVLSLPTVNRTGPIFIYRWLGQQEQVAVSEGSDDMLLYSFQVQSGYLLLIEYDNSWMK